MKIFRNRQSITERTLEEKLERLKTKRPYVAKAYEDAYYAHISMRQSLDEIDKEIAALEGALKRMREW